MSPTQAKRLWRVIFMLLGGLMVIGLILFALKHHVNLFYTPSEVTQGLAPANQRMRLGGMVVEGSFERGEGLAVTFALTDYEATVTVQYTGILPDLFREGQGIVTTGQLTPAGDFLAHEVLAKHDENYMPPEVKASLRKTP